MLTIADVLFDALFWFITTSYTTFLGQNEPLRIKKEPLWANIGYLKMSVFLKNIDSEFGPNAPKGHFWVNNELRKRWGQTYIEKFWQW